MQARARGRFHACVGVHACSCVRACVRACAVHCAYHSGNGPRPESMGHARLCVRWCARVFVCVRFIVHTIVAMDRDESRWVTLAILTVEVAIGRVGKIANSL